MSILINGSFGIGKTTVARLLRDRLPGSVVFNPEPVGLVLQYLSRWVPLEGRHIDILQDLVLWRRTCVWGIRLIQRLGGTAIVPMAFSNLSYLREIVTGVEASERKGLHVCLVAPLWVVQRRLKAPADAEGGAPSPWTLRRAAECCAAHRSPDFAVHLHVGTRTPADVAAEVVALASALRNTSQATSGQALSVEHGALS